MNFGKSLLISTLLSLFAVGTAFAGDFYWVGNSGVWSDASHWSNTSGGNGGAGVPSMNDDIFFDANSFSSYNSIVSITSNISINSLAIKKNAVYFTLTANVSNKIDIYGGIDVKGIFANEIKSSIYFKNNQNQNHEMYFGLFKWKANFYFEGKGTYLFKSALQAHNNAITINSGTLDLNGYAVFCSSFISISNLKRKLISKKSTILAYDYWKTSKTKFNYDFSQTKLYVISSDINAVDKGGDRYILKQSKNSSASKTISLFTIQNDTVSCGNACDGVLTVNFNTTCPNAFVDWLPLGVDTYFGECRLCPIPGPIGSNTISLLCPGSYTAVITNDCDADIQAPTADVEGHPQIVELSHIENDVTCNGVCDGSASGLYTGAPYAIFAYDWLGQGNTTPIIGPVCAGSYDLEVQDGFGCIDTFTFVINEPDSLYANVTVTDPACFGECSGSATASPTGGTSLYSYLWNTSLVDTFATLNNLCAGVSYTVIVTDANGCFNDTTITPTAPPQIILDSSSVPVSCGNACDGQATVTVLGGGTGPFTHNWSNGVIFVGSSSTITGLCAGPYCDTIVDANGCDTIYCFVIAEPVALITSTTFTNLTCNGICDGTATTNPVGGVPFLVYVWNTIPGGGPIGGGQGTDSIFNLCPGTYYVDITDGNGCTVSDTVTITEPPVIVVNPTGTNITCPGFCDGTATASPTGGTGNPSGWGYSWTGTSCSPCLTQSISSLCPGTYILTVTDSLGCTAVDSVILTEPPALVLVMSSTDQSCAGVCDGTAAVNATGGYAPFTYTWAPPVIPNGQGTDSIWGLCAGIYTVTVTDSAGCTANNNVTVSPAVPIVANLVTTDLSCNGVCNGTATISPTGGVAPYTVSWNGAAAGSPGAGPFTIGSLCAGAHTALITDNNGCTLLVNFNINQPPPLTLTTPTTDVTCFGLCDGTAIPTPGGGTPPYLIGVTPPTPGPPFIAMCAGVYVFTVTDDSLCTTTDTVQIFAPSEIFPNATSTDITCNGLNDGCASSIPTGGAPPYVSIVWTTLPGAVVISGNPICGLSAGQYVVTVTDNNGCIGMDTVTITDPPVLTVIATATAASCGTICDGTAIATPIGGTPGYTYSWDDPSGQTTQIASGLCAGTYTVTITDTNGCTAQDTTVINPLITININPTIILISCNNACDGTATVFPLGGTLPYTYLWNAPIPNTDSIVTGLCPGWVVVTVTDANGCATTDSVEMPLDPSVLQTGGMIVSPISCAGACDGVVTHSPTGGTIPYASAVWTIPGGIDTNNVCPPYAVITVTDAAGCIASDTLIFNDPTQIIPNDVVTDVLCFGDSTGCITLSPTGGTGGVYNYVWTGPVIGSGSSTCNLPAGIYTITVTDSNGCQITVIDTINEPPVLSAIPIGVNVSCFGLCDGIMTVIPNGGVSPYTYIWALSSPPTLNVAGDSLTNVCAPFLSNTVTVIDVNGCQTSVNIVITEPLLLDANVTGTPIGCSGLCDGTALSTPTGGTAPYQFSWTTGADSSGITGLCIGNYLVTVTDTNGCIDTATYTVTAPLALTVVLSSTNITCNGDNDGTATATPSGGTLPYSYVWVGPAACNPNPGNTAVITGLCPGIYTVNVTDSNGCFFIGSVTIVEPLPIDDNEVIAPANCGVCDGSITMFPSGGVPFYSHSWSTGFSGNPITNLCAGFYTDTITDLNNCVAIFTIAITNPTGPSGITATVNDATCFGACDGSLNAIPIGGTGPYTWAWTGPGGFTGTDSTETGLCAGTYNLVLTEISTGCILATSLVVGEADSITPNSTFTNASCNGVCDGTASVTPTGGTAPYTFLWSSNGSTASSISGLCTGSVSVTITDFNGCTNVVNFVITSPNTLAIASTTIDATCNGDCDGSATANPAGGTAPYTYQWDDPLSQTTQTATGLCARTYIVTVTDFNGCSGNDTVVILEPTLIVANAVTTNSTCGNFDGTASVCASSGGTGTHTYLWTTLFNATVCSVSGLAAGTYPVDITDANLCTQTFLITISDANGPVVAVAVTPASCNGVCDGQATASVISGTPPYTYLWQTGGQNTPTITGLCAGSYSVQVTDGNGCITTQPVTITDNTSITATVTTIDASCNGVCDGSALVVPNGGIPPYNYSWVGGPATGQTVNAVGGLCAGNYTVTITDANGCSLIQNVTINEPNLLTVSIVGVAANCNGACDGQATATPAGGTGPYTYLWSTNATTPTITALCAGNYTVTITDANGCTTIGNVTIGDGVLITATINTVDATCGLCDGSITVSGGGGSGAPYTYLWSPLGQITPSISNLCPGAYQVDITDNAGCTQQFNILISNANGPALTTLADSVTCFGACDGIAWVTINAGNPPYIIQWNDPGPPGLTTNDTASALCAGLYNVVVQDGLGCVTVDSVTVLEPQEILANITFTDPSCPGSCDGTATANTTGGIGPYTYNWILTGDTNQTIVGLCGGEYFLIITDANGCSIVDSVTLTDPTNISITISSTSVTCNGDCDGTAIANASGGTPPYTYSWNTTPVNNNSLVGGLCVGWYTVTVTDNNGCTDTAGVQVIDPPVLSTTSTPTALTCSGVCDGSITTTPAGGVGPYTYIWSNGGTSQTISSLCAGVYDVIVVDANNCTAYDTITLAALPILNDSTVVNGPTCNACDGSATSTPFGGAGPFDFIWTNLTAPPFSQTDLNLASSTATGLCAGTYNLQITDNNGCVYNYTIIVNSVNGATLAMTSTDETCASACDGTATATPTGGTAPYTYSWVPVGPPTNTLQTATGLCVGLYTVTVTDTNGCITSDTISINSTGLNLSITNVVPETCFGDCDGIAVVSVSGGTPVYTYLWSDPLNQNTPTADSLCVGIYLVTVTDAALCTDSISTNITGPAVLTVTASINTPISCNSICDGVAIANVTGGTTNYTYAWNDPSNQTTQIATGLCAGTYIVVVTDNNGCTATDTIIITEPTPILDNVVIVPPACGVCDGSISVLAATGGTGPYTYLWTTPTAPTVDPQPITASIINLCAGAYSVIITDITGCSANFNYPLSNINAPVPNTTVTNVTCNGLCNGEIIAAPTGGTAPYTYFWNPTGADSIGITGLCPGPFYIVNVTDAAGCVGIAIDSITQPAVLQANLTASNINCNGACDGWVVSNTIGGTGPYAYTWTSSPSGQIAVGQGTDSISGLCAGTYFVTITDANNCPVTLDSIIIIEPTLITATSTQVDVTCTINCDGSATVTPSGGVGPYTFQWNGNTIPGQGATQTGLCFGINTVEIFDQNLCSIMDTINIGATDTVLGDAGLDTTICLGSTANLNGIPSGTFTGVEWFELPSMVSLGTTNSITVTPSATGVFCYAFQVTGACVYLDTICVTVDPAPTANAGTDVTIFNGSSTTLNATGGFTYSWSPGTDLSDSTISNPVASPTVTTTYYVTVTSSNGCTAIDSVVVTVLPNIIFPNGISPNGDGANDVWIIDFIEQFPNNVVEIYNRWGELLFHADGYLQNWDGTYNGEELPIGTYYYIIDLHEEEIEPFTGPITVLR